jgi:hypothetical protein
MSTEFHLSLAGLPVILRDLLAKLPFHSGPLPDTEGFIRHMKGVILPPRPEPEDTSAQEAEALVLGGGADGDSGAVGAPSWLGKHAQDEADDENDEPGKAAPVVEEDVFRIRKRARKAI